MSELFLMCPIFTAEDVENGISRQSYLWVCEDRMKVAQFLNRKHGRVFTIPMMDEIKDAEVVLRK